jgi:hypothetical protein
MRMTLYESLCSGALEVSEEAVDRCLAQIRKLHGKADWFKRHVFLQSPHLKELQFAGCETSLERLVAHFINGGLELKTIAPHLSRVAGRDLHRSDVDKVVLSLLEGEFIFGCALSPEDRATIKEVVLQPKEKIPRHLQSFGQIRRMRRFIRMFAADSPVPSAAESTASQARGRRNKPASHPRSQKR